MRFIPIFGLLIALSGCGGEPAKTISVCIKSHTAHSWMMVGKAMKPTRRKVCDERETRPNPRYAKWLEKRAAK